MEKLLAFLAIRALTHNNQEAMFFYDVLFSDDQVSQPKSIEKEIPQIQQPKKELSGSVKKPIKEVRRAPNNKTELLESLNYLKSKKAKTKEDRQSIGILEAVLKNMV
jgi:hypothetical protein